jgi:AAA+ superfamily predicted ATPase
MSAAATATGRPGTATLGPPGTAAPGQPGTTAPGPPGTTAPGPPGTVPPGRPGTAEPSPLAAPAAQAAAPPYRDNWEHLQDELAWLDRLLFLRLLERRETGGGDALEPFRGLVISEHEVLQLLSAAAPGSPAAAAPAAREPADAAARERAFAALVQLGVRIEERRRAGLEDRPREAELRLPRLARLFDLNSFEERSILVCLAPEIERRYEKLYGFLHDDVTRRQPTVGLLLELLCGSRQEAIAARPLFSPEGTLLRGRLMVMGGDPARAGAGSGATLLARSLKLDDRIVEYLLGADSLPASLQEIAQLLPPRLPGPAAADGEPAAAVGEPAALGEPVTTAGKPAAVDGPAADLPAADLRRRMAALIRARLEHPRAAPVLFYLRGPNGAGKRALARDVCGELGLPLIAADLGRLSAGAPEPGHEPGEAARLLAREAVLQPAALCLSGCDRLLEGGAEGKPALETLAALGEALRLFSRVTFLLGETPWSAAASRALGAAAADPASTDTAPPGGASPYPAPPDLEPRDLEPSNFAPPDPASPDPAPRDVAPSNVTPSNPAPSNLVPSNLAPLNLAPSDLAPSNLAPSDLASPELTSSDPAPSDLAPPYPAPPPAAAATVVEVVLGLPDLPAARALWQRELDRLAAPPDLDAGALASRFRLSASQIRDSAALAEALASWRSPAGGAVTAGDLLTACRAQADRKLAQVARQVEPRARWTDLVLPADQMAQLREICDQARYRHVVLGDWGFARRLSLGKGLNVLFSGPPGTGKTMAAEVIANELELDLYKIDLSQVVSKYIGETEKNLDRVFAAAESASAILFFDEADALFGKRSEVKDSHDRYANVEISYLLQKMEEYEGVAILATNLRQNLDAAFQRRLAFTVHFPFPDEESRRRIWEGAWPPETPLAGDVDPVLLARRFKLAGGNIKNIALAAAFLAAAEHARVAHAHLLRATRRELQKLGKTITEAEVAEP